MPAPKSPLLQPLVAGLLALLVACCLALALSRGTDDRAAPGFDADASDRALDELFRAVRRRSAAKERLAEQVAEGRLALTDAAARFRDLDRQPPPFHWDHFRHAYPGRSDEERHCREVIRFVRVTQDRPDSGAVAARLEAELRDLLDRGALRLPEAPPGRPLRAP
jgi:hypothetical protein